MKERKQRKTTKKRDPKEREKKKRQGKRQSKIQIGNEKPQVEGLAR